MKTAHAILTVAIAISLSGCITVGKPKVTPPAAPQPAPAPPPPAPAPQPLSLPQTRVQLPPQQPIDDDALPVATPTAEVQPVPPPVTRAARKQKPTTPVVTAPPEQAATPPANAAASAPPAETERGDVQQFLSPIEKQRLKNNADSQKRLVHQFFNSSKGRRLDANDPMVVRIKSFMQASDEKEEKGDMREASELADRALGLVRELQSGR